MVDVAREQHDGRRSLAALPGADLAQKLGDPVERAPECRPVVEVHRPPELLAQFGSRGAPRPGADLLVPRLRVVHPVREQIGVRGRDQQVVEVAVGLLTDPFPLPIVEDRTPALFQDPPGA